MEISLKHNEQAVDWANGAERVKVFSVTRTTPNPDLGKPRTDIERPEQGAADYADDWAAPIDERETVEVTVDYTMPAVPNAGLALEYLRLARQNADVAASWLLELAVGAEGYTALVEELTREPDPAAASATMQAVIQSVAQRALGGLSGKA